MELVKTLAVSDFIMICINYDGKKLICLYLEISQMHSCLPFFKIEDEDPEDTLNLTNET